MTKRNDWLWGPECGSHGQLFLVLNAIDVIREIVC